MNATVLVAHREQLGGVNAWLDLRATRERDGDHLVEFGELPSFIKPLLQEVLGDEHGIGRIQTKQIAAAVVVAVVCVQDATVRRRADRWLPVLLREDDE